LAGAFELAQTWNTPLDKLSARQREDLLDYFMSCVRRRQARLKRNCTPRANRKAI